MPTRIRFVLVHPRTPENLGAAARAMKNFGQDEWTWIRPPWTPDDPRGRTLAVGAADVLASARVAPSLEAAVADCSWVVGTSGRPGLRPAPLDPEAFAAEAARRSGPVALVFGDERTGLSRADLARCHAVTRIPSDARQPSLNLAQAICVYAYALFRTAGPRRQRDRPAPTRICAGSRACSRRSSRPPGSSVQGAPESPVWWIRGEGPV